MSNKCIVVFIGLPGSGKTHFYNYIVDRLNIENTKISYISYDEQEKRLEKTEYKNFRKMVHEKVDNLLEEIADCKDNEIIVIDDNMFYRSMRRSFFNLARKYASGFCQVYFKCNVDVAIERNGKRTRDSVPTETINEMNTKLEPPSKDNWEIFSCEINSEREYNEDDIKLISDLIQEAMKNPVKVEEPEDIPQQTPSLYHNVDLMLRKLVSRNIKDAIVANKPQLTIQALSEELLLRKKSIMDNLKRKELFLPEFEDEEELETIMCELLDRKEIRIEEVPSKKAKYSNGHGSTNGSNDTD